MDQAIRLLIKVVEKYAPGDAEQGAPRLRAVIVTFSMTSTAGGCEAAGPGAQEKADGLS